MKKSIFSFALAMLFAGSMFCSLNSQAKKVEKPGLNFQDNKKNIKDNKKEIQANKQSIQENKQDIKQLEKSSDSDFQNFKNESLNQINDNNKLIPKFRTDIMNENSVPQDRDRQKLNALEKKNNELKVKLEKYKNNDKNDWREFRTGFVKELHDVTQGFKDFTKRVTD